MRRKIKELMNKEEGFTLVELLAVIVILGIIVAIAIPSIGNVIGNSRDKADAAEVLLIEDAARLYEVATDTKLGETAEAGVSVASLIDEGYLELRGGDTNTSGTVRRATATEATADNVTFVVEGRD